jgi:hypothetical protein
MADEAAIRRQLGGLPCDQLPLRTDPPTPFEYTAAELFIRYQYERDIRVRFPGTAVVTWQLDFLFQEFQAEAYSPAIATILKYLRSDFTNPLSTGRARQFAKSYRDGTLTDAMFTDMITSPAETGSQTCAASRPTSTRP